MLGNCLVGEPSRFHITCEIERQVLAMVGPGERLSIDVSPINILILLETQALSKQGKSTESSICDSQMWADCPSL